MVKFRKMLVDNKGFTLIELLVVIAVLGILAAIAIPRLAGVRDKASDTNIDAAVGSLRNAMEMYYAENGEYPTKMDGKTNFANLVGHISEFTTIPDISEYIEAIVADDVTVTADDFTIDFTSANTSKVYRLEPEGLTINP